MMNEEDRKKVFWLLKKYSSYTAWQALGDAYAEFVSAWEYAMENAETGLIGSQITGWYKKILNGQIAFEKGLPRLREGQRSVFRNTSTGYINRAADAIIFVNRIMDPDEFVFDWMVNKDDVVQAAQMLKSKISGLFLICEADELPMVAYGVALMFRPSTAPYNFPVILPDVPSPTDELVETGNEVPVTGVWEPEWRNAPGLLKSLTGIPTKSEKGCMTYLLAGASASKYKENYGEPELDVTWRLIWADHRYEDGTIPEEEAEYLAEAAPTPRPERLRGLPNEPVPKTGWWSTPALNAGASRYFEQGQLFPPTKTSNYGDVIWNYDATQQPPPKESA